MKKKVNNALYKSINVIGASTAKQILWYFTNALVFKHSFIPMNRLKIFLLKSFGATIGTGVVIKPCVNIKFPWKLQLGNYTWVGENAWIDNLSNVTIGDNVTISQGALLLAGSHSANSEFFDEVNYPIVLEDGVWIGARAVVFGGVTCKTHSILGLNSVAEKNLEPYIIYKGNPAIPVIERIIF